MMTREACVSVNDFIVVDLDSDGCLICRSKETGEEYNCGEGLQDFGLKNLVESEISQLLKLGSSLSVGNRKLLENEVENRGA